MSESEDDVPLSKLIKRDNAKISGEDEESIAPPSSTQNPPPTTTSKTSDSEEGKATDEKQLASKAEEISDTPEIASTEEELQPQSAVTEEATALPKEAENSLKKSEKDMQTSKEEQTDATFQEEPQAKENLEQTEVPFRAQSEEQKKSHGEDADNESSAEPHTQSDKGQSETLPLQQEGGDKLNVDGSLQAMPPETFQTSVTPMEPGPSSSSMDENKVIDDKQAEGAVDDKTIPGHPPIKTETLHELDNDKTEQRETKPPHQSLPFQQKQTEESEKEGLEDVFQLVTIRKTRKIGSKIRSKKRKAAKIKINLKCGANNSSTYKADCLRGEEKKIFEDNRKRYEASLFTAACKSEEDPDLMDVFLDSLAFYSETHEDQDPMFIEFTKKKEKQRLESELARLEQEEKMGVIEIERIVAMQLKEKQASTDRNIERLRSKGSMEEQKDLQKLLQIFNEKTASNQAKINQGIKLLSRRHEQEIQKAAMQYRQRAQQRQMSEQQANSEWAAASQQLQLKHQRQMQEFNAKGDEVKKKCEGEYNREQEKLRNHHDRRKRETEHLMSKIVGRMHSNFQHQRLRHLQRHADKMKNKRAFLLSAMGEAEVVSTKGNDDGKKPVQESDKEFSPLKSDIVQFDENDEERSAAATRQKHRKALLGNVDKQMAVEIHNEGLWMSSLVEKKEESRKSREAVSKPDNDTDFIPWGVQARSILHSIVSGNIPVGYDADRFDFGDAIASQGGHIRCVVTDMRTSDATASSERAAAAREQEEATIADLEVKSKKYSELLIDAENNHRRAEAEEKECAIAVAKSRKEYEKVKQMLSDFKTKFKDYFGPDGNPVMTPNPDDRQKLMAAMMRYKTNVEAAESREKVVVKALSEAKTHAQKMHAVVRQTQKSAIAAAALLKRKKATLSDSRASSRAGRSKLSDAADLARASNRVGDVISVLRRTADRRREQLNQKRSSSASSMWVQALPGVSGPLKKSLWHKMHRRRQQIVLRPTMESTLMGLKESILFGPRGRTTPPSNDDLDKTVRAEQLFLQTAYPVAPSKPLPSVPGKSSSEQWAEPGWHVVLDVPKVEKRSCALLPCAPKFPLLQQNQAEFSSAPGRQAASMLKAPFMRTLAAPLSAAAQAISLTETTPSVLCASDYSENDPLNCSEAVLLAGYKFPTKNTSKAPSQSRKRASSSTPKVEVPESIATPKRKNSAETATKGQSSTRSTSVAKERSGTTENRAKTERRSSASKSGTKRSRSKAKTESSPRTQRKRQSKTAVSQQPIESQAHGYMQQQAVSMGVRGVYSQQAQQTMEQQAAQYNQFMKQRDALQMQQQLPLASSPQQAGQQQVTLQQLQSQQQQMQVPPQQQLMSQPHQQYASPQQQFHQQQQQMAQMRMMQQQQQQQSGRQSQVPPSYGQPQAAQQMQAFFPPHMQQQTSRQKSFGGQQPMGMPANRGMGQPVMGAQQTTSPRRSSQQQVGDEHDPLLFLNGEM